jgi:hypothetical protein
MSGQTKTSVFVWAGDDIYSIIHIDADLQGNPNAIYQEAAKQLLPAIIDDFGQGAELTHSSEDDPQVFRINVDDVAY